jgi:hypothetical protein
VYTSDSRYPKCLTRGILPLVLLTLAMGYLFYSHVFYCELVRFSSFIRIDEKLYVSREIQEEQYENILAIREQAELRIADFWGKKKASPVIIVCAEAGEYEKYCHSTEGAGCSLGTIYGNSFIVLNAYGLNTDVMSHEMCHSELFSRLGWRKTTFDIPQWFHEGLAMMLDHRFVNVSDSADRYRRYAREWKLRTRPPAARLPLEDIYSLKDFFQGDNRRVTLAYITAATEISYWLMIVGKQGMHDWEAAMQNGDHFESYHYTEERYRKKQDDPLPVNPIRQLSLHKPGE